MIRRRLAAVFALGWTSVVGWGWTHRTPDLSDPSSHPGWNGADEEGVQTQSWIAIDELPAPVWQAFVASHSERDGDHRRRMAGRLSSLGTRGTRGLDPKIPQQMILEARLLNELSDPELIALFVNAVPHGHGVLGVEAAAWYWFGKPAEQLDPGEAALLAGMVDAPSRYDPRRQPELASYHRARVLAAMVERGWLDPAEAKGLGGAPLPCGGPPWRSFPIEPPP